MKTIIKKGKHLSYIIKDGWEYIERNANKKVVVMFAKNNDNKILLVEQFRKPVNSYVIECPAGLVEDSESIIEGALRELYEETGYKANKIKPLFMGPASSGSSSEMLTFLLAFKLEKIVKLPPCDGNEKIKLHEISLSNIDKWLRKMMREGKLISPRIYVGLYFLMKEKK